jgi:hypothetical protein
MDANAAARKHTIKINEMFLIIKHLMRLLSVVICIIGIFFLLDSLIPRSQNQHTAPYIFEMLLGFLMLINGIYFYKKTR